MFKHRPFWNKSVERSPVQRCVLASAFILVLSMGCTGSSNNAKPGSITIKPATKAGLSGELKGLNHRAIALLENYAESDKAGTFLNEAADGFRRMATLDPTNAAAVQNLCLTLLSRIKLVDAIESKNVFDSLCKEFETMIATLRKLTPDDPDADILASRYHFARNDRERAVGCLRDAIKTKNADAACYFQLADLLISDLDPANQNELLELYRSGLKLAPNNLVLAVGYLDQLAKTGNMEYVAQAEVCRELLRPVLSRTNSIITTLLDKGIDAAKKAEWRTSQTQTAFLQNVLRPELAMQNDRNLLEPHLLDYVRLEERSPKEAEASESSSTSHQSFVNRGHYSQLKDTVTALAAEDFNLDGYLDLICAVGKRIEVWSYDKSGGLAERLASLELDLDVRGIIAADLDHDFQFRKEQLPQSALPTTAPPDVGPSPNAQLVDTDVDLVVYGDGGVRLLRNDLDANTGKRSLVMITPDPFSSLSQVTAGSVSDMDHDSDLDLVFASGQGVTLWSNRGDWTFADFTSFSSLPNVATGIHSILPIDADRTVLNKFLISGSSVPQPIFLDNNLHGRYKMRDIDWGFKEQGICRSIEAIDVNGDACWDLVFTGARGTSWIAMKSVGRHGWSPDAMHSLSSRPMQSLLAADFDFDGFQDCLVWGEDAVELFRGSSNGDLKLDKNAMQTQAGWLQGVALDVDRDGDDDLVYVEKNRSVSWIENVNGNKNQHVEVVIRADEEGSQFPRKRCNMHGVGSLIELKGGSQYQSRIVRGTRTKFGVGSTRSADIMRIVWTNGIPNNVLNVSQKSTVFDQQNLGGSCPYLYAWNGTQFEFCTDCLWAAPIGLQFAQGVSAPTRDWEYLKIDGSAIQPRNGRYVLQVTEELWEAAYFDAVELLAVDHPKDIDVYTNEKVGPAEIADFRVFTVKNRMSPRSVRDSHGRDLSELVARRDQRYAKPWQLAINQGLVEEHWLEIDLNNDRNDAGESILYLTGWVFPTCTSLNLAMTENPNCPKQKPPAIQVPNDQGEWVEVIPYAGFPGGKTKTIAIDLSGKFLCKDHRVRLVTNMELCWDEVFWTFGETRSQADEYRIRKLKLLHADLHYRGFSELVPQAHSAPKKFNYQKVTKESIWPPMLGEFTKYGDVAELLAAPDDRQVVMGAGDEMTLEFVTDMDALPDGWVRDFIVYNVGWDKDADLNTVHGQHVGPLPFRSMKRYPYEPEESFPSSPLHIDFLRRFQIRQQDSRLFWNQIRDAL